MNHFLPQELTKVQSDQHDNQLLQMLIKKYQQAQITAKQHQSQTQTLKKQIQFLKEQNCQLIAQIKAIKSQSGLQQDKNTCANTFIKTVQNSPFTKSNSQFFRNIDTSTYTQQTKRRVINGFVGQLTHELEESQILLQKQRKMQEEVRKHLQLSNEEVSTLKIALKDLENRVISLTLQNQKLYSELKTEREAKCNVQQHYQMSMIKLNKQSCEKALNLQQLQMELNKMDAVYSNIEMQLSTFT